MAKLLSNFDSVEFNGDVSEDLILDINNGRSHRFILDNFSNWYVFNGDIILGMPLLRKYENIIRSNVRPYKIPSDRFYRPEYVSYDLYGTTDYWYLLLFLNFMKSADDFTQEVIWVFDESLIETLNKILLTEGNKLATRNSPRVIEKDVMKNIESSSDRVISDEDNDRIPGKNPPNWHDVVPELFGNYTLFSKEIIQGLMTNKDGDDVPPFTLNERGLFNVPSMYFKNGYSQELKGKILLKKDKNYVFVKAYNGWADFKLTSINSGKVYSPLTSEFHQFWEPELYADFRKADTEDQTSVAQNHIEFDSVAGKYENTVNGHVSASNQTVAAVYFENYKYDQSKTGTDVPYDDPAYQFNNGQYFSEHWEYNNIKRRFDLDRIKDAQYLGFNLEYSSFIPDSDLEKVNATSYRTTLVFSDGSKQIENAYVDEMNKVYDTHGERTFLKFSMTNKGYSEGKTIAGILFEAVVDVKPGYNDLNITYKLYSMGISRQKPSTIETDFSVDEDGWYTLEANYYYTSNGNRDLGPIKIEIPQVWDKPDFGGIYYHPQIRERITPNGDAIDTDLIINDGGDHANTSKVNLKPARIVLDQKAPYTKQQILYSNNIALPEEYVMVLKMKYLSPETGGAVGFSFDYDHNQENGYMMWISGNKGNKNLPEFSKYDSWDITPSGTYELDSRAPNKINYPIFEGDNSLGTLDLTNQNYKNVDGLIIKIIKKFNRIRVYVNLDGLSPNLDIKWQNSPKLYNPNNYDYYTPFYSLLDGQDIHTGGGLGFFAYYAGLQVDILEYYPNTNNE